MGQNFISCDRGQSFLLPPSLTDWLAEDHLVWTVLGAVELSFTEREKIAVLLAVGAGVRGSRVCSVVRLVDDLPRVATQCRDRTWPR